MSAIYAGYVGARNCTGGPQPGARGLMSWYLAKYADDGAVNSGIYNCRAIRGGATTSLHGEGRAVDLGVRPYGAKYGDELADLLRLNSAALGIQCIIWNKRIWSGYYKDWQDYNGINPHTDHLHVELSWGAAETSELAMVARLEEYLAPALELVPAGVVDPAPVPRVQSSKAVPDGSTEFPTDYEDVDLDRNLDVLTVGALQILMHAVGRRNNRQWDGIAGPRTWQDLMEQLQANGYYVRTRHARGNVRKGTPLVADGIPGYWFWWELQLFLRSKGFYNVTPGGYTLTVDGEGEGRSWTVYGLQQYLNTQNGR